MPLGLIQGLANIFRQKKANKALEQLLQKDPTYQQSPYAAQQLGLSKQLFNGRMFGAPQLEKNIFTSGANFNANVNRNATDSSQALALGAAGQGQTDAALQDLQTKEQQNKYGLLKNLNEAYAGMINEGDKGYNDQVRRFGDLAQIKGQEQQNKTNALTGIFNGINSDFNDALGIFGIASGMPGFGVSKMGTQQTSKPNYPSYYQGGQKPNLGLINSSFGG